jgi:hypothetical protein
MTIALGILGGKSDNMVLAADTEITAEPYKGEGFKIPFWFEGENGQVTGGLALTGAGDSAYLEVIASELSRAFSVNRHASMDQLENLFRHHLQTFYKNHIIPFLKLPSHERPEIWLIIAAQRDGQSRMWKTERNTIIRVHNFAVAGLGRLQAESLLGTFYLPEVLLEIDEIIAAYVVFQVKTTVGYTGQDTDLIAFGGQGPRMGFDREAVRAFEEVFRSFSTVQGRLLHSVFGNIDCSQESVINRIAEMREAFDTALFKHASGNVSREVLSRTRWAKRERSDPLP